MLSVASLAYSRGSHDTAAPFVTSSWIQSRSLCCSKTNWGWGCFFSPARTLRRTTFATGSGSFSKKKKSASDRLKCWIITWPSILAAFQIYIPAASETLRGNVCLGDFLRRMLLRLVKKKKKSAKNPPKKQETVTGNRWTSRKLFRPERKDGLHCFFVFSNLE